MALDYGAARIGIAVTDELGLLAHPRPFADAKRLKAALAQLAEVAQEEAIERVVVGLPLTLKGERGEAAQRAHQFAVQVAKTLGVPVELWDERLSTVQASARLRQAGKNAKKGRAHIDSESACVILQAYLERHRGA